ncbi:MAG: hypothetical protein BGN85_02495 [Alphaproteobacteria bacterium 64-11]|nr:MAG: hypothetical protein BGN85_02495 [Alphaproteobacteria bacterium 64-11]
MARYARGVNRLDGELVKSCFHPDATENHGAFRGAAQEFATNLPDGLRKGFQFTFHFLGNSLIEIEGNRAACETYFVGYHRLHPEADGTEKDVLFGGRYLGVHESRNRGPWLIAKRMVVHDWNRLDRVTELWPSVEAFEQGVHTGGNTDFVYHLLK